MVRNGVAVGVAGVLVALIGLVLVASANQRTISTGAVAVVVERTVAGRVLAAEVVVVGKVVAVEAEGVEATTGNTSPSYGGVGRAKHTVVSVKIQDPLVLNKNVTHLKVGFVPGTADQLTAGGEYLLFLSKHPTEGFQVAPAGSPPVAVKDEAAAQAALAEAKRVGGVLSDPTAALAATKADDRAFAAAVLITRYRTPPAGRGLEFEDLSAEESGMLLKALGEGDWAGDKAALAGNPSGGVSVFTAFRMLGLTERDGWVSPKASDVTEMGAAYKTAFAKWLDGPGRNYRAKKLVAKK